MNKITVVDARMGRGKSSAAIRYMKEHADDKNFMYITPFLSEVERVCSACDFEEPNSDTRTKSSMLKEMLRNGQNIAATHSLFYLMDAEALHLAEDQGYVLIIDETINVIERVNITPNDMQLITSNLTVEEDEGILRWKADSSDYTGRFRDYKEMADSGSLFRLDGALLNILSPDLLKAFDEIFLLTYMFEGQYLKAYLDCFKFEYSIVGVEIDKRDGEYYFSEEPDRPDLVDYSRLIHIVEKPKANMIGNSRTALSKTWYAGKSYESQDIRTLRSAMKKFFVESSGGANGRLWTCYKESSSKLIEAGTGRFRKNFLQVNSRATNEFKDCTDIAYMVNRFIDPNLRKFFAARGAAIDGDKFAVSQMLQWIWRSAIRDDKPINLFIPSRRMRNLLLDWVEDQKTGGVDEGGDVE